MEPLVIRTPRLILREWQEEDRPYIAALTADPRVMKFFPALLSRAESDALIDRMISMQKERGFCFWCVEVPGVVPCAGFIGLSAPRFETDFTPCVETGWRLAYEHQGKGYATEGAQAALDFARDVLKLKEVLSFAAPGNTPSINVMKKIGMSYRKEFDHPLMPEGSPFKKCVLYGKTF